MRFFTIIGFSVLTAASALAGVTEKKAASPASVAKARGTVLSKAPEVNNDVIYYPPEEAEETLLARSCDGFITQAFTATHSRIQGSMVKMAETPDGKVYLNHMASEYPIGTWIEATKDGNKITISGVNAIYVEYDYDLDEEVYEYLVPMRQVIDENNQGTFVATDDLTFTFIIGEDGSLTAADPEILLGLCLRSANPEATGNNLWVWAGFGDRDIKMTPVTSTLVEGPSDSADFYRWVFSDEYDHAFVNVAIDGDDFYLQGADRSLPDSWIKGKIDGDKVSFPSGQYLGADEEIYYYSYFYGAEFSTVDGVLHSSLADSAEFAYDAEAKRISTINGYIINSTPDTLFPLYSYQDVTIGAQERNPEAVPAAPYDVVADEDYGSTVLWFMMPNTDVDGKLLDSERLFYEVLVHGKAHEFDLFNIETMEEYTSSLVPYAYNDDWDFWVEGMDHTVYIQMDFTDDIEIVSVYINEDGKQLRSAPGEANGVNEIKDPGKVIGEVWYDLQGHRIQRPDSGLAIRTFIYEDGSRKTAKVMRR